MQITYSCGPQDFIEAQRTHCWRKKGASAGQWRIFYRVLGVFFVGLGTFEYLHWHASPGLASVVVLCGLYLSLGSLVISPWLWRRAYRKRHSDGPRTSTLTFDSEAIGCDTPGHSKATFEWNAIKGFLKGDRTLLLYVSPVTFLHIPKRVLSETDEQELISLLKDKGVPFTFPVPAKK